MCRLATDPNHGTQKHGAGWGLEDDIGQQKKWTIRHELRAAMLVISSLVELADGETQPLIFSNNSISMCYGGGGWAGQQVQSCVLQCKVKHHYPVSGVSAGIGFQYIQIKSCNNKLSFITGSGCFASFMGMARP